MYNKQLRYYTKYLALTEIFFYIPLLPVWAFIHFWSLEHIIQWYLTAHIYSIPMGIVFRKVLGYDKVQKWLEL